MTGPAPVRKRFLYLLRSPPHGSIFAQEGFETVLVGAAFEQAVSLLFLDDGVFVLKRGQTPDALGLKDFARGFRALPDYGVQGLYVEDRSLAARGLAASDLLADVELVSPERAARLIDEHDVVLSF